jgi:hypothetical protein
VEGLWPLATGRTRTLRNVPNSQASQASVASPPNSDFSPYPYTTAAVPPSPSLSPLRNRRSAQLATSGLRDHLYMRTALVVEGYQGAHDGCGYGTVGVVGDVAGDAAVADPPRTTLLRSMGRRLATARCNATASANHVLPRYETPPLRTPYPARRCTAHGTQTPLSAFVGRGSAHIFDHYSHRRFAFMTPRRHPPHGPHPTQDLGRRNEPIIIGAVILRLAKIIEKAIKQRTSAQ